MLKIKLIVIGNELLSGRTTDKNGPWIASFLKQRGFVVGQIVIIKDLPDQIESEIKHSLEHFDLVITTGGLGPTEDDITKKVIAKLFNKKLTFSKEAEEIVIKNYERLSRQWNPNSNFYHFIPEDFTPLNNPTGLAPAFFHVENKKVLAMLPGVPHEVVSITEQVLWPKVLDFFNVKNKVDHRIAIRTQGIPEEKIFYELCPNLWEDLSKFGEVSSLPHLIGIDIIVKCQNLENINKVSDFILTTPLKETIWQIGNLEMPELIIKKLKEKKATISFAESCTGGLTSNRITNISGASEVFLGGAITYSNESKSNILGVHTSTLKEFGAVSEQVALEMAIGAKTKFKSDYAVSFTGIAGPNGGTETKPVGTVAIGISTPTKNLSYLIKTKGDRERLKLRFSEFGLFFLLNEL